MKQEIIKKAQNVLHTRKRQAEREFEEKMSPLYADEEFVNVNKQLTKLMIENAKKEINGEKKDEAAEKTFQTQIEKLKEKHGLKDVKVSYACKLCKDNGFKNGEMCQCLKKEISKVLLEDSGFSNLESFEEGMKKCGSLQPHYALMQKWCQSDFKKNLIYLAGPTGVGKTYLLRCMANELIERGKVVKIVTAYQMNQDFKEFSRTFNEEILNRYIDIEILFIDDLGTEPLFKNVTLEHLYLIINERKMKKLPTIITSNLDMDDLKNRYDERITSRIADRESSITTYLEGEDKRLQKR
ncbi:MAG: ATP-binding protein [Clostridia bacterium]|nr:ATP-binding protein [Clostridia bacterium]